jgi:hypothetical protein
MKHLKSYKVFESTDDLDYTLIEEIKEILLPFSDMDMKVRCDYTDNGNSISLNIMTLKEKAFDINDYKSDIDALLSYMKENNWCIWKFNLGIVEQKEDWSGTFLLAKDQEVLSYKNGPIQYDKVKSPTFWITAEFVKIIYAKARQIKESRFVDNSNKEILDNIEEIFREIEDLGFKVESHKNIDGSDEGMESDDELMRIYIEKFDTYGFGDEEREVKYYPTHEFVLALQHLISYISQDYDIEIESICDSQCIDHLSSKSEDGLIENDVTIIGNYKAPIDYIKIIISNKD